MRNLLFRFLTLNGNRISILLFIFFLAGSLFNAYAQDVGKTLAERPDFPAMQSS